MADQALTGKAAVITGASSGIGRAYATALDALGVDLVLVGRSEARLAAVAETLTRKAVIVEGDVASSDTAQRGVDAALDAFGRLDIALPNAGLYLPDKGWEVKPSVIDEIVTTNVLGVMHLTHAALRHFHTVNAGDIVVTSSVSGHQAISWEPVYSATKHAVQGFVHATRQQLIGSGIRLGSVAPGIVLNELWGRYAGDASVEVELAGGRGMTSEDVAEAVIFMLTRPSYLTIRDMVLLPTAQPI